MPKLVGHENVTLGLPVPPFNEHTIIGSLPTWRDNVDLHRGEDRVWNALVVRYPRFFQQPTVRALSVICERKYALDGETCHLFSCKQSAEECRKFLLEREAAPSGSTAPIRVLQYTVCPQAASDSCDKTGPCGELHMVFFPGSLYMPATAFWTCTGLGISSRYAEYCLSLLPDQAKLSPGGPIQPSLTISPSEMTSEARTTPSEQRNLLLSSGKLAKEVLRRRIAKLVTTGSLEDDTQGPYVGTRDGHLDALKGDVHENDVYLFPTGMTAIWNAHQLCLRALPPAKSVCFGFSYSETLEVTKEWGPGVHFFGRGHYSDMDALEKLLAEEYSREPTKPPILALFTDFSSNPLLRSPNLPRLRELADEYNFPLIIDDTVGSAVNVEVLPYADIVVTSLSKIFSGAANVMGGSLVLNPKGRHYATFKSHMASYVDLYFDGDALVMEYNSRDLPQRVRAIDENALAVCEFLRSRSVAAGAPSAVIKEVLYPKYSSAADYLRCKRPEGGFGGMFSLTFVSVAAAAAFYDALTCYKGPSLGTNFTLATAYATMVYLDKMEWAAQYGLEEASVRISVGMEDKGWLFRVFDAALKAAELHGDKQPLKSNL